MNYREQHFRQIIKRDYVLKKDFQSLELEKTLLESDLEALRTSLDFSNLDHWEQENQALKEALTTANDFLKDQYLLVQSQENTITEQAITIQNLTQTLQTKTQLLGKKNTLLRELLTQKQEQLSNHA